MTTIEINSTNYYNWNQPNTSMMLGMRPAFRMIDRTTATIDDYATIKFFCRPEDLFTEKKAACDLCKRHTNGEILPALAFMNVVHEDDLYTLLDNLRMFESEPMIFYPFVKNEKELREYLESDWNAPADEVNDHIQRFGNRYEYSPIGAIFANY